MTKFHQFSFFLSVAALSLLLPACGGGSSSSGPATLAPTAEEPTPQEPEPPVIPDPPLPKNDDGLLKRAASDEELAAAIREGMSQNIFSDPPGANDFSPAPPSTGSELPGVLPDFSTTNLQEEGVDEADRVKYDGEILYVSDYVEVEPESAASSSGLQASSLSFFPDPRSFKPVITLLRTDPESATVLEAGRIELTEYDDNLKLYVRTTGEQKQLLGISESYSFPHWGAFTDYGYWQSQRTQLRSWTVDDPEAPTEEFSLDIEGALLASRRVGDTLYIVTRFAPVVEGLLRYTASNEDLVHNEGLLQSAQAADLLPEYSLDGLPAELLVKGTDCYVPNGDYGGSQSLANSGSIITITAVDLSDPGKFSSACLNGYASGFYMSYQSLYLTTNAGRDKTLIHKIALNSGEPLYRGSGEINGYLGTSNPSFLMSEKGADLRVVSSLWRSQGFPLPIMPDVDASGDPGPQEELYGDHQLTILRESDNSNRLDRIARLPNKDRQDHIGKPGESIFAARFLGDRAYVVTFRRVDPLYVIDLSDPLDPRIEGELEIPGFSTLLQPLGEGLLLGVGNEVSVAVPVIQGVKVALFDVSDAQNPVVPGSEIIGRRGSDSPALNDHHALTLLKTDEEYRLALPIYRNGNSGSGGTASISSDWSDTALYEFTVDVATGSLRQVGKVLVEGRSGSAVQYPSVRLDQGRSFIHDDAVFFSLIGREEILSGFWAE